MDDLGGCPYMMGSFHGIHGGVKWIDMDKWKDFSGGCPTTFCGIFSGPMGVFHNGVHEMVNSDEV